MKYFEKFSKDDWKYRDKTSKEILKNTGISRKKVLGVIRSRNIRKFQVGTLIPLQEKPREKLLTKSCTEIREKYRKTLRKKSFDGLLQEPRKNPKRSYCNRKAMKEHCTRHPYSSVNYVAISIIRFFKFNLSKTGAFASSILTTLEI